MQELTEEALDDFAAWREQRATQTIDLSAGAYLKEIQDQADVERVATIRRVLRNPEATMTEKFKEIERIVNE